MFAAQQQFGPYVLVRELGRGTFGVVWLAERRSRLVTTECALKFPVGDNIDIEEIRREAALWVRASGHPNILPVIEAEIYADQVVIVSEYAPEGTLANWLRRQGRKAPGVEVAVTMCAGILAGLGHLHSRQLLHRDLKPENILLQGESPRIADFGLARVLWSRASTRRAAGTPAYMAPEAWDGERTVESDLWSVGIILYEMLAGARPFVATDLKRLERIIRTKEPADLPPGTPEQLRDTVVQALMKRKEDRFCSAGQMLASLTGRVVRGQDQANPAEPDGLGGPLLVELLNRLARELTGGSPVNRAKAAKELGRLGSDASPAVPILCRAVGDPSALVRAAARKALEAIGTSDALRCLEQVDSKE
jgi:serine/threonine protein kinase